MRIRYHHAIYSSEMSLGLPVMPVFVGSRLLYPNIEIL